MILANRKISGRTPHARRAAPCPVRGRRQEMQGIPMVLQWVEREPDRSEGLHQMTRYSRHVLNAWVFQGKLRFAPNRKIWILFWQARLLRNAWISTSFEGRRELIFLAGLLLVAPETQALVMLYGDFGNILAMSRFLGNHPTGPISGETQFRQ